MGMIWLTNKVLLKMSRKISSWWFPQFWFLYTPVNQPEKIDQSDSFLPTAELAYKEVFYF